MAISFSFAFYSQERDTNVICLNFGTNKYEEVKLRIRCEGDSVFYFSGLLKDDSWMLEYPRRLYEKCECFQIDIPTYIDTIRRSICFKQIVDNDTLRAPQFMFDNIDTVVINAGLKMKTDTFPNIPALDSVNNKIFFETILSDVYFLNNITDKEYLSSVELAANGYFIMTEADTAQTHYDNRINRYAETVRKYPDSQSLIAMLNGLKNQYDTKEDVQKIFDNFSGKQKQSYFGIKIREFLSDVYFKNMLLPVWDTGNPEPVIKDFSKINLVIFSASWCKHCIAEIPVLKKIAGELSDKVAMVYISMDDTTTVDAWKKLMINKEITWRSVLAAGNLEEINKQFFNPGLPSVLMVYPDGKYEKIEVRSDAGLKKLYEIAGVQ
ncbi:MAG: TlpA family protein disulfide reductase [Candidatus Azobacteroides sp.]|nr:TlpA family protein disulfide reductase [Candidatus Azobacteroides sp.]